MVQCSSRLVLVLQHDDRNNDRDDDKDDETEDEANPPLLARCTRRIHGLLGIVQAAGSLAQSTY